MHQEIWIGLTKTAAAEVAAVMAELPDPVRQRVLDLPVTFEPQPNPAMVAGGIHPDRTLGLFTGVPYPAVMAVSQRLPPQIILFLVNIWNYAGHDRTVFAEQVRITLLHEIGHYLGLDERGVRTRGL